MVQSRQRLRVRQSDWRGRIGHLRPHGNRAKLGTGRAPAGTAAPGADRRGPQGPDGRRAQARLVATALAAIALAAAGCGSTTAASDAAIERSQAGLEQV